MTSSDHTERLGRVEYGSAWDKGDSFFTGIDDIAECQRRSSSPICQVSSRINLIPSGIRTHTKNTVLGLEPDVGTLWQVIGGHDRHAHTKIAVVTVF